MWNRKRDSQILSVGVVSVTKGFVIVHEKGSDDWGIRIPAVQESDRGAYECKVSTSWPLTHDVYLDVIGKV